MEPTVETLQGFIHGDHIRSLIVAIIIMVVTAVVAHVAIKVVRRLMHSDLNPLPAMSLVVNVARIAIWIMGLSVMLSVCFGIDVNALITALGVGGIAISLGLQDTIKNFIGGVQVIVMGIVRPGDHIAVGNVDGIVTDVTWRHTVVEDYQKAVYLIPNSQINSTTVTKVLPPFFVGNTIVFNNDGRDLDATIAEMEKLAKEAIERVTPLEKDPWILITKIGEYGSWAKLRFVLKSPGKAREATDAALRAIAPYTRANASDVALPEHGSESPTTTSS